MVASDESEGGLDFTATVKVRLACNEIIQR